MKDRVERWKILDWLVFGNRLKKALMFAALLAVMTLLFAVGSLGYYLARYLHLTYTTDPAVRTLDVEGTVAQVSAALEDQKEEIEDILPPNSRLLFTSGRLAGGEHSLCLAGATENTPLPLKAGQRPDFARGEGVLLPHHFTTPAGERVEAADYIGSDLVVFINLYVFDPLTEDVQIKERRQFSVKITGTYDETEIIANENTAFVAADLVARWNTLSQQALLSDSQIVESCYVVVKNPKKVRNIQCLLRSRGLAAHPVFTWNSVGIAGGIMLGVLFLLVGLPALWGLNLYFCRQTLWQARGSIRRLARLGQPPREMQSLFFRHYTLLTAAAFPVAVCLSQPFLVPVGKNLLEGYYVTGGFNLFTLFLLLVAVASVFFLIRRQLPLAAQDEDGSDDNGEL